MRRAAGDTTARIQSRCRSACVPASQSAVHTSLSQRTLQVTQASVLAVYEGKDAVYRGLQLQERPVQRGDDAQCVGRRGHVQG